MQELLDNQELFFDLRSSLQTFPPDFDKVVSKFALKAPDANRSKNQSARIALLVEQMVKTRQCLVAVTSISKLTETGEAALFQEIHSAISSPVLTKLEEDIDHFLDDDVRSLQSGFRRRAQQVCSEFLLWK